MSLVGESRSHAVCALIVLESGECGDARIEAKLRVSHASGLKLEEALMLKVEGAWQRYIELADRIGNANIRLRAL
ncbi:hypothetical protein [Methylobacterium sp.]|uniref:hypothetical protein n=1 Tax=Methylobacterium sp. TaxID=409 RepID=UPI000C4AC43B|nr:hypothetical protein [Methylobacterium sp.]MBP32569.1 hypothetical protein [Methylobacterium sp.]